MPGLGVGPGRALPFWLAFFLFAVYLLSFSGRFHVMDELAVFTAGNSLAQHGRADINPLIWTHHWTPNPPGIWGQDGNLYTKKAPGISFMTAPLIRLGHALPGLNAVHVGLLTNAVVTALTAAFLVMWLVDLGFNRFTAGFTTLAYGLGTMAWVYARMFWESSLLALCFLLAVWAAWRVTRADTRRRALWLLLGGAAAAVGLTQRFETAPAILLFGLYLWLNRASLTGSLPARQHAPRIALYTLIFLAPSLLAGLGLLAFNYIRYGSFSETGYSQEMLFQRPWEGSFGLLFSPGVGLFIYAPILWLLFWGVRPAWRRLPRLYFRLIGLLCLFYWLFYGSWFAWGGAWGWGPRFLLAILPLLMLFVAAAVAESQGERIGEWPRSGGEWPRSGGESAAGDRQQGRSHTGFVSRLTFYGLRFLVPVLFLLGIAVNLLGILVDFNEHFLRLGSGSDFVFNWAHFPPLAHWHILREGLVDVAWLQPQPGGGLSIAWPVLLPALVLLGLALAGLAWSGREAAASPRFWRPGQPLLLGLAVLAGLLLTWLVMRGTAGLALTGGQAAADAPLLAALEAGSRPGDVLLVTLPPFGDVQEVTTRLLAYLDRSGPVYAWIEDGPRAIQGEERERVWQAALTGARRVWLFERWLTQAEPSGPTAARLNQAAFTVQEQWFEGSGKLSLFALAEAAPTPAPVNVSFTGGLRLLDFAVAGGPAIEPGSILPVSLTWQAAGGAEPATTALPAAAGPVTGFVQLVDEAGRKVAQQDRLLVDLQNFQQSPLVPGQTLAQGYGLLLPADLPPGAYALIAGAYLTSSGQRLPRVDGSPDDFIYLTTLTVE